MAALDLPWLDQMSTPKSIMVGNGTPTVSINHDTTSATPPSTFGSFSDSASTVTGHDHSHSQHRSGSGDKSNSHSPNNGNLRQENTSNVSSSNGGNPSTTTYAAFSPATLSSKTPHKPSSTKRSTILVHQKSPLLMATPPQVTRALAYSHPFLLPLNRLVGLITWTTNDPWESFLLVAGFWAVVLYGDVVLRLASPIVIVLGLILGMYGRRFSPLSSSGWRGTVPGSKEGKYANSSTRAEAGGAGGKGNSKNATSSGSTGIGSSSTSGTLGSHAAPTDHHASKSNYTHNRSTSEMTSTRHQKTLDEIVETLKEFTARCNILLEPLLELTDFLSTQQTATSATVRPALTTLFIRILVCTPFWIALTLPPWRIITTRRVIFILGTLILTWHARVMQVSRTILWRSLTVRRGLSIITGLEFDYYRKQSFTATGGDHSKGPVSAAGTDSPSKKGGSSGSSTLQNHHHGPLHSASRGRRNDFRDAGVKFTFIIYENQRRWVGIGWTTSLFAYERAAWTDEHNNKIPAKDDFELPDVSEDSKMHWRWVEGSEWRVDGVSVTDDNQGAMDYDGEAGKMGWVYYDNKWQNGRRGVDGWGKWTRRRKWYRDAELVEVDDEEDASQDTASTHTESNELSNVKKNLEGLSTSSSTTTSRSVASRASSFLRSRPSKESLISEPTCATDKATELPACPASSSSSTTGIDKGRNRSSSKNDDSSSISSFFLGNTFRRRKADSIKSTIVKAAVPGVSKRKKRREQGDGHSGSSSSTTADGVDEDDYDEDDVTLDSHPLFPTDQKTASGKNNSNNGSKQCDPKDVVDRHAQARDHLSNLWELG